MTASRDLARLAQVPSIAGRFAWTGAGWEALTNDADLLNRANHSGSQAISTVTGLQSALDAKAALNNTVLQYGGATKFQTTSAGVSITGTFSATSDRKFKSNIRPHDAASAWARLGQLRTCAFFYDLIGTDYTGWIAQEVQPIYPHSVSEVGGEEGTHLTLSRDEIIADLVAVVQDQQRRIAQLESGHDSTQ
ncbi:hypothetical protein GNE00_15890 [Pseudomonas sp. JL972]|uniref:tail fiber domain-containing protein n=1 Tax=Stutzerimonas degradans TaxID=2968968 RepID=UPI0012D8DECB|nr:tail fiber domain-containing protein [Stutzerimonas degradans]MTZ15231.1 hypothetical protein [Stutzerimonas degradans]